MPRQFVFANTYILSFLYLYHITIYSILSIILMPLIILSLSLTTALNTVNTLRFILLCLRLLS